jgi:hypothetical protein
MANHVSRKKNRKSLKNLKILLIGYNLSYRLDFPLVIETKSSPTV